DDPCAVPGPVRKGDPGLSGAPRREAASNEDQAANDQGGSQYAWEKRGAVLLPWKIREIESQGDHERADRDQHQTRDGVVGWHSSAGARLDWLIAVFGPECGIPVPAHGPEAERDAGDAASPEHRTSPVRSASRAP